MARSPALTPFLKDPCHWTTLGSGANRNKVVKHLPSPPAVAAGRKTRTDKGAVVFPTARFSIPSGQVEQKAGCCDICFLQSHYC